MVPTSGGDGTAIRGAFVAHALATGTAVVLRQLGSELALAVVAGEDVLVGHPIGRAGGILHQA